MYESQDTELDALDESELRKRIDRGDYIDKSIRSQAERALRRKEKERAFQERCELASKSAAIIATRNSTRANYIALGALIVSILSSHEQLLKLASAIKALVLR